MMRRIGRSKNTNNNNNNNNNSADTKNEMNIPDDDPSINGVGSLLGADLKSLLDGESVLLPSDDDMSSINTYTYSVADNPRVVDLPDEDSTVNSEKREGVRSWIMGGVPSLRNSSDANRDSSADVAAAAAAASSNPEDNPPSGGGRDSYRRNCVPLWLTNSPQWLKAAIIIATALLIGAVVLVAVAATLNKNSNAGSGTTSESAIGPSSVSSAPVPVLTVPPVSESPSQSPSNSRPSTTQPSITTEAPQTGTPSSSKDQTKPPKTQAPVENTPTSPVLSTTSPTAQPNGNTKTIFYLTGGRPQDSDLDDFETNLSQLPMDASFMVHLGDWNSPFGTGCDENSFQTVETLFSQSPVPVYFIPGDNEYNDCPDPTSAYALWQEYLIGFETKFWDPPVWTVNRYTGVLNENWAFIRKRALFIGINLVGGAVHDTTEWATRHTADLEWIDLQVEAAKQSNQLGVLVVFVHADPSIDTNAPFFTPFFEKVQSTYLVPTVLVHRNLGVESASSQENYMGINDFVLLVVEGGTWPPMRVVIDTLNGQFNWNQDTWFPA